jgi:hypothetical protein
VCRLTGAGPDTQSRYLVQVERLAGWLREVERSRDRKIERSKDRKIERLEGALPDLHIEPSDDR